MVVLYTTLLTPTAVLRCQAPGASEPRGSEADRLYAGRAVLENARRAAAIWSATPPGDPAALENAWKLARAQYWIGQHAPHEESRAAFERGMEAARRVIALAPGRPEGHFWLAANMGGLAETQGVSAGLHYRTPIRESLERVLAIDPGFQQGSPDRALGRWYFKVPRLFGGNKGESEAHLRKALTYNPQSSATWSFLADTLFAMGRDAEARAALQHVIDAPLDPDWAPEDREFKAKAKERLGGMKE